MRRASLADARRASAQLTTERRDRMRRVNIEYVYVHTVVLNIYSYR